MSWTIRPLATTDAPLVQELLAASPTYTRRVEGREVGPQDGAAVLTALPPDTPPGAKTVWGLFDAEGRDLLGLCDVVRHWPARGVAHVGLLLIREDTAGRGLGRLLHDSVLAQLAAEGDLATLRLGVVSTNAEVAEPFWERLGYVRSGEVQPYGQGLPGATVSIWSRPLRAAVGLHHLELWCADLTVSEAAWGWLLEMLGWQERRVPGWDLGRTWHHADGSYIVLEQSAAVQGERADRLRPGMNHVALRITCRAALDALRIAAPEHGWRELFTERYPHAGGEDHVAWYAEAPEGIEVEVVAPPTAS